MTEQETGAWLTELIAKDRLHDFYISPEWEHLRRTVMDENKCECQWCKQRGLYIPAVIVHHVQFVRRHPELALSRTYEYRNETCQNLIPLCRSCHELAHGGRGLSASRAPLTVELW